MDNLARHNDSTALPYSERRYAWRYTPGQTFAITHSGVGRVININHQGLSFGFLYPHTFKELIEIGLLDAQGNYLQQLALRIVWQKSVPETDSEFRLLVGAEFLDMHVEQQNKLGEMLNNAASYN